MYFPL